MIAIHSFKNLDDVCGSLSANRTYLMPGLDLKSLPAVEAQALVTARIEGTVLLFVQTDHAQLRFFKDIEHLQDELFLGEVLELTLMEAGRDDERVFGLVVDINQI